MDKIYIQISLEENSLNSLHDDLNDYPRVILDNTRIVL